jgi:uncharacterized glyoxalase superfamily protein PhnB
MVAQFNGGSKTMSITTYLYYEDVAGALKFLSKAFGLRAYGPKVKGTDGKINHASMKLGDDLIMMGYPGPKYKSPKRLGQTTQCLYINVGDVDKHFARARKAGATILEEPADTEYGHRRYGAADPEGHQWYFAHEVTSVPAKKPAKRRKKLGKNK